MLEPYPKEFWFGWSGGGLKIATTGVSKSMVPTSSYYQLFKSRVLTSSCRAPFIVWVCLCFWHAHHHQNYLPKALSSRTSMVPHYLQFKNLEQINGLLVPPFLVIHQQQCLFTVLSQGAFWTPKIKVKKKKKSESWVMCTCFKGSVQKQTNLKIPLLVDTLIGKKEGLE